MPLVLAHATQSSPVEGVHKKLEAAALMVGVILKGELNATLLSGPAFTIGNEYTLMDEVAELVKQPAASFKLMV